jgi:predicted butyrate kinase (DUF1464 family)
MAVRVAGADPGTSSLDLLVLQDGAVADQHRFTPDEVRTDPNAVLGWLARRGPFDLVAGPSGYGLPLVGARECTNRQRGLMSLVRPDDQARGVAGFSRLIEVLCESPLPVVFLPGVVHLPTVPAHRKVNRIDLGTADKLCVAALALALCEGQLEAYRACVVELGSVFTACVVLAGGRVVDGRGGTCGPIGCGSGGAWDGELAYLLSPLTKDDLFTGGVEGLEDRALARRAFCEGLLEAVAGLLAVTPCDEIVLSGRLLQTQPDLASAAAETLSALRPVAALGSLPGAWVKHAAQGAAVVADGLAGGRRAGLVGSLRLLESSGSVLDGVTHPRARDVLSCGLLPGG